MSNRAELIQASQLVRISTHRRRVAVAADTWHRNKRAPHLRERRLGKVAPRRLQQEHERLALRAVRAWLRSSAEGEGINGVKEPAVLGQASFDEVERF